MKQTGMLVVSLRGCKFWILVSLRVFRAKRQYFMPPRSPLGFREKNTELCEEKQKSNFLFNLFCLPHCLCDYKLNL